MDQIDKAFLKCWSTFLGLKIWKANEGLRPDLRYLWYFIQLLIFYCTSLWNEAQWVRSSKYSTFVTLVWRISSLHNMYQEFWRSNSRSWEYFCQCLPWLTPRLKKSSLHWLIDTFYDSNVHFVAGLSWRRPSAVFRSILRQVVVMFLWHRWPLF